MKTYVKTSLALVASLILLLNVPNKHQQLQTAVAEDTTTQSSEIKQSSQQSSEKKDETKNYILFTIAIPENFYLDIHC